MLDKVFITFGARENSSPDVEFNRSELGDFLYFIIDPLIVYAFVTHE